MIPEAEKYLNIAKPKKRVQKRNKNDNEESRIQDAIAKYLNKLGWLVVRINSSMLRVDNRVLRSYLIYGLGISSGMPDLIAYKGEKYLLLEVKTKKGRLSANQKRVKEYAHQKWVNYHVVRSVEDVEVLL